MHIFQYHFSFNSYLFTEGAVEAESGAVVNRPRGGFGGFGTVTRADVGGIRARFER